METTGLMNLLAQKMTYLNQKQTVQAENVANASTPGYRALEVEAFTFDKALQQSTVSMAVDNPGHIVPASMSGANARTSKVKTYSIHPDHNSVDTEQEMMKVSQTNVEYQAVTSIYHKFAGLFKIALKGSSS